MCLSACDRAVRLEEHGYYVHKGNTDERIGETLNRRHRLLDKAS
jgi:hypothetical protein